MAEVESVEDILGRWNKPPSNDGLTRMVGEDVPKGDTRATVAAGNNEINYSDKQSSSVDASLPDGVKTLTVDATVEDDYTNQSHADLKEEIDARNTDREDDDQISKGGSADDLRARLREDDLQQDSGTPGE
jgi:hypothetical protein